MKVATPRRIISNNKFRKTSTKADSPSFSTMLTLRRIESLLLSTSEEVLNLNDALNCHIDSSNSQFQEMKDKFASLTNTMVVINQDAICSTDEDEDSDEESEDENEIAEQELFSKLKKIMKNYEELNFNRLI
ncbi:Hypothetical predicted protein [Mytilus galloprovincialis]|uniref:Uncharacterized protein n=1 Tax=Mytilus galloprovincialis TaxID=29158 RepID=A0A8B6HMA7_MYTGA|nr:Hypothetical predicted protein [Mytilus galloprovincialis]